MARQAKINLMPFCAGVDTSNDHQQQYDLSMPWVVGQFIYATDGVCIIRVKREVASCSCGSSVNVPKIGTLFERMKRVRQWRKCLPVAPDLLPYTNFNGKWLQEKYVSLLRRFSKLEWGELDDESTSLVYFRFNGGAAIVMPVVIGTTEESS